MRALRAALYWLAVIAVALAALAGLLLLLESRDASPVGVQAASARS